METTLVALRVALSLAAVLGLLWVLQRKLTKGSLGGRTPNLVTVVGRQGVGQKASVVVVDIEGRRFVLGVTEQSVSLLHGGSTTITTEGGTGATEFARLLAAATDAEPGSAPALTGAGPAAPTHTATTATPAPTAARFAGSILSAGTWQQAAAALRQRR